MPNEKENVEKLVFDSEQFRVPASDTKGHNTRMYFTAQPGHAQMISSIVSKNVFPYRNKGDLLRHAMLRHLKWLESLAPVPSTTKEVDAILEILRDDEFRRELGDVLGKLSQNVTEHISKNAQGEARRLVLKVKRHVSQMPEGYWRDRYVKELDDRFGYLLENTERASLLNLAKE